MQKINMRVPQKHKAYKYFRFTKLIAQREQSEGVSKYAKKPRLYLANDAEASFTLINAAEHQVAVASNLHCIKAECEDQGGCLSPWQNLQFLYMKFRKRGKVDGKIHPKQIVLKY